MFKAWLAERKHLTYTEYLALDLIARMEIEMEYKATAHR